MWADFGLLESAIQLIALILGGAALYLVSNFIFGLRLHHFKVSR